MKIAYLDCFSGISGDMLLGALLDAGLELDALKEDLHRLPLTGYNISTSKVERQHLVGTKVVVETATRLPNLPAMIDLMERGQIEPEIKELSARIITRLVQAEAKLHGQTLETAHLHEVGSLDTIVDVVGSLYGLQRLGVKKIFSSPLALGRGRLRTAHGYIPIPSPATCELVKGFPVYSQGIEAELTTPTGAAIVTGIASGFGPLPEMRIEAIGYGAGERDLPDTPNLLRIFIGQKEEKYETDEIVVIETNIDDQNPQIYDYLLERLFETGALDVYLTPIQMKKNRPGLLLTVLAELSSQDQISSLILSETTSLGLRFSQQRRRKLSRQVKTINTKYGPIRVKIAAVGDEQKISPEYEDIKQTARKHNIPFQLLYQEVMGRLLEA
ncbi:MAG: nickel pincer cofactor biosynthesis protein LarC [bacterium]